LIVPEASVFALLGPNGAGKTTTLKAIDGRLRPTRGCVHVAGTHVNGAATDALTRAGVCSIPEGRGVFPNLTVGENLRMMSYSGTPERDVEDVAYSRFPILGERRAQLAGTLSGGQQQMLAMARALSADPSLLLVDELSMGPSSMPAHRPSTSSTTAPTRPRRRTLLSPGACPRPRAPPTPAPSGTAWRRSSGPGRWAGTSAPP